LHFGDLEFSTLEKMVSPMKSPPQTVEMIKEITQIHFKQHSERTAWRAQLIALRNNLSPQEPLRTNERESNSTISLLQARCSSLEDELRRERQKERSLKSKLEEQKLAFEAKIQALTKEVLQERERRNNVADRARKLVKTIERSRQQIV
jgi:hypothetical protein